MVLAFAAIWLVTFAGCLTYWMKIKDGITKGVIALALIFSLIPIAGQCMAFIGLVIVLYQWE